MISFKRIFAVTPSDTVDLAIPAKAVVAGANGTLKVDMIGIGTGITLTVIAGQIYPINIKRIYATGTSATGIVGLY
jgi:hypothetical protein